MIQAAIYEKSYWKINSLCQQRQDIYCVIQCNCDWFLQSIDRGFSFPVDLESHNAHWLNTDVNIKLVKYLFINSEKMFKLDCLRNPYLSYYSKCSSFQWQYLGKDQDVIERKGLRCDQNNRLKHNINILLIQYLNLYIYNVPIGTCYLSMLSLEVILFLLIQQAKAIL